MPTPPEFKAPFRPECFFHIVFKSIDGVLLFREDKDYHVFLQRFQQFTNSVLDVWSYSLLSNHTHHIIKIKPLTAVLENIKKLSDQTLAMKSLLADQNNEQLFDGMIERQMNSFLVSFANYTNNKYNRKGGLFQKPFRRIEVADDIHLQQAIIYVHANGQKHNIVLDFKEHPYNSYFPILKNDTSFIDVNNVLNFFDGPEKFAAIHKSQVDYYYGGNWPFSKLE
jgi:putative transposase